MASKQLTINLDDRELTKHLTVSVFVTVKKSVLVNVGILLIKIGCYISGINYREPDA